MCFSCPAIANEKITLMLDWFPNMDHLPIYVAQQQGFFARHNLDVKIQVPSDTSDPIKLAATGQTDISVGYEPQTLIAVSEGISVLAFGRLMDRPLTCVLFLDNGTIKKPGDLSGKKLGYTVPGLMDLLLDGFAKCNKISDYTKINVGYSIIPSLVSGQVAAIMGPFKNIEHITARHQNVKTAYFELQKFGIPNYDELIFITGPATWQKKSQALRAFRDSVREAVEFIDENASTAFDDYLKSVPDADAKIEKDTFAATVPNLARNQKFEEADWQKFADFALQSGIISKPIKVGKVLIK